MNATASVKADTTGSQNITLDSGFGDIDSDGLMTLDGSILAGSTSGLITLDLNAQQGAIQAGTGTLSGFGLQLLSTGSGGSFDLDNTTTNDIDTLAAETAGSIAYADTSALNVATAGATTGITTSSDDVTLCATSITLAASVTVGTGTLRLRSTTGTGNQASGSVTAATLGIDAANGTSLSTATNDVDTFAADGGTGSVVFLDADGYTIGSVAANGCFTATVTGITTGGDFETCVTTVSYTHLRAHETLR